MCRGRPCGDPHEHWTKRRIRRRTLYAATRNASLVGKNHAYGTTSPFLKTLAGLLIREERIPASTLKPAPHNFP